MSIKISITKSTGWSAAIEDAKKHIERLQTSIRFFEKQKEAGEPWPGDIAGTHAETPEVATQS